MGEQLLLVLAQLCFFFTSTLFTTVREKSMFLLETSLPSMGLILKS